MIWQNCPVKCRKLRLYKNRTLWTPHLVEAKDLPSTVRDNKASSWGVNAYSALAAWGAYGFRGGGVKVAALGTGVDPTDPDLQGKISDWAEFDFDGLQVPGSTAHDSDQYGTHVCGTVAGGDESGQWMGVAPDAPIAAARVRLRKISASPLIKAIRPNRHRRFGFIQASDWR